MVLIIELLLPVVESVTSSSLFTTQEWRRRRRMNCVIPARSLNEIVVSVRNFSHHPASAYI